MRDSTVVLIASRRDSPARQVRAFLNGIQSMHLASLTGLMDLLRRQWRSPEDIAELQRRELSAMVRHAYERVPYYHDLFGSVGAKPADIRTAEDLRRIPITTRATIQSLPPEAIVARGTELGACKEITTAGSSGAPLCVVLRHSDSSFYDMVWARAALANGQKLRDRVACLKFHVPPRRWFERLGIWRKDIVSLALPAERQVDELVRCRPDVLRANAYQLVELAERLLRAGVGTVRPRLVFSMGSVLDEASRRLVARAFGGEVFDFYGATELGCIAWECREHDGYHINADTVFVEFVTPNGPAAPGEMGRVVCTGLHAFGMPFIRYDLGDVAVPDERRCACGRGLPMMRRIVGRADDFFVARDGTVRSPSIIVNRVKLIPGIARFHLTQRRDRRILARIVPADGFGDAARAQVVATLQKIMADGSKVDVETVPEIPADPAMKVRCLISELPAPF